MIARIFGPASALKVQEGELTDNVKLIATSKTPSITLPIDALGLPVRQDHFTLSQFSQKGRPIRNGCEISPKII